MLADSHMVAHDPSRSRLFKLMELGSSVLGVQTKLKPRSGAGLASWKLELDSVLDEAGLLESSMEGPPPVEWYAKHQADIGKRSSEQIMADVDSLLNEYAAENTVIFNIIMNSIDLSGPHHEADLHDINRRFRHGKEKDGYGLRKWVESKGDKSSYSAQDELVKKLTGMKLRGGNDAKACQELEVHCSSMLMLWLEVTGSDVSTPAGFYHYLVQSLPMQDSILGKLRAWLVDKITDNADITHCPYELVTRLVSHARALGLGEQTGPPRVMAVNRQNNCNFCDAWDCNSNNNGGKPSCLVFSNADVSAYSPGAQRYIIGGRAYVKAHPGTTTLKGVSFPFAPKDQVTAVAKNTAHDQVTAILESGGNNRLGEEHLKLFEDLYNSKAGLIMPVVSTNLQLSHAGASKDFNSLLSDSGGGIFPVAAHSITARAGTADELRSPSLKETRAMARMHVERDKQGKDMPMLVVPHRSGVFPMIVSRFKHLSITADQFNNILLGCLAVVTFYPRFKPIKEKLQSKLSYILGWTAAYVLSSPHAQYLRARIADLVIPLLLGSSSSPTLERVTT